MDIIAFDPGSRSLGVAYMHDNQCISKQLFVGGSDVDLGERFINIVKELDIFWESITSYTNKLAGVIESCVAVKFASRNQVIHYESRGVVKYWAASRLGLNDLAEITPSQLKKYATGISTATKEEVTNAMQIKWKREMGEDEADAVAIAGAFLRSLN